MRRTRQVRKDSLHKLDCRGFGEEASVLEDLEGLNR